MGRVESVSPDGRTSNVGEVLTDKNGKAKLAATTNLQTFSLFITVEPYFAVRQPSEVARHTKSGRVLRSLK